MFTFPASSFYILLPLCMFLIILSLENLPNLFLSFLELFLRRSKTFSFIAKRKNTYEVFHRTSMHKAFLGNICNLYFWIIFLVLFNLERSIRRISLYKNNSFSARWIFLDISSEGAKVGNKENILVTSKRTDSTPTASSKHLTLPTSPRLLWQTVR